MFLKRQRIFFYGLVNIIENRMNNPDPTVKYVSEAVRKD